MNDKHNFTTKSFALTYLFVFSGFLVLNAAVAIFALIPKASFEIDKVAMSLLYVFLSHLVGWSIAYTRYFYVPNGQKVLWAGGVVSSIMISLFQPIYLYVQNASDGLSLTSPFTEIVGTTLLATPFMWLQLLITAIYWRLLIMLWNFLVRFAMKLMAIVFPGAKSRP